MVQCLSSLGLCLEARVYDSLSGPHGIDIADDSTWFKLRFYHHNTTDKQVVC